PPRDMRMPDLMSVRAKRAAGLRQCCAGATRAPVPSFPRKRESISPRAFGPDELAAQYPPRNSCRSGFSRERCEGFEASCYRLAAWVWRVSISKMLIDCSRLKPLLQVERAIERA